MPNRIIKETIRTSKSVNALTDFQFRLWLYLITYVDDFGRGSADPELLKGLVFPRRKGVTEGQISDALTVLANTGMIILYENDGESYFYFPNWGDHQRIQTRHSKFPDPAESTVIHGEPPLESNTNRIQKESNTNTKGERASAFTPPTLKEVEDYCRERNSPVDPKQFYDYFSTGDWKDAKGNPVRNWKQKLLTWEKYDAKDDKKASAAQKHVSESFAKESDNDKLERMKRMMQHMGGNDGNT